MPTQTERKLWSISLFVRLCVLQVLLGFQMLTKSSRFSDTSEREERYQRFGIRWCAERVGPYPPHRSLPVKWFAYLSASWFWPPEFKLGHWLWLCDLRIPYYTSISSTVPLYTHPLNCKFYIESVLLLMSLHLLSRIIFITLSVSLSPTPAPPTEQLEVGRGRLSLCIAHGDCHLQSPPSHFPSNTAAIDQVCLCRSIRTISFASVLPPLSHILWHLSSLNLFPVRWVWDGRGSEFGSSMLC